MKRPSVESIVQTIKDAYAATGRTPCRGRWLDAKNDACCPGAALELALGSGGVETMDQAGRARLRALLGGGVHTDSGFIDGFDGHESVPHHKLCVQSWRYRPLTDAEYADYLWAFHVGRRVAQELGVAP